MLGAIAGDYIGSVYEFHNDREFDKLFADDCFYTDDTVLTIAAAEAILNLGDDFKNATQEDIVREFRDCYLKHSVAHLHDVEDRGFGGHFAAMISQGKLEPYNSYGNGSAMRVSPASWAFVNNGNLIDALNWARYSALPSHDHEEGIKGAQAVAAAIFVASSEPYAIIEDKDGIIDHVASLGYDRDELVKDPSEFPKKFDVTCQGTIPRCMSIFYHHDKFEHAMIECIKMGGDVDTNCAIVGSMMEAYYGLPEKVLEEVLKRLPENMLDIVTDFVNMYGEDYLQDSVKRILEDIGRLA
jgi:ADP-ribosylglycohydrolase